MPSVRKLLCLFVFIASACHSTSFGGVVFTITYDDTYLSGAVGDGNIIGTGILSYDGILTPGNFLLSDLPNFAYSSTFPSTPTGARFTQSDLAYFLGAENIGIRVTDQGGGNFSMVFTGVHREFAVGAAFYNETGFLSHRGNYSGGGPSSFRISHPPGNGDFVFLGEYIGVTSVPEPVSVVMWSSLGVIGLVASRRRVSRRSAGRTGQ